MLTESFGLEAKHGDPDCHHSAGFHQKKRKNTNVCGRELKIHMCVCVYSYTCAPQECIYIDFQRGENLPSYKRQMSWRASIARAVLAHFWFPCVLVEGNSGCHMPTGTFTWLIFFWFSTSLDMVAQQFHAHFGHLSWQLHIVCICTRETRWVLDIHLRKEFSNADCN